MERKIDNLLSKILPNGLPKYAGLPRYWKLHPYFLIFFFLICNTIIYSVLKEIVERFSEETFLAILELILLFIPILFLSWNVYKLYIWFKPFPLPHTADEYQSFAELIKKKGNSRQSLIYQEYLYHHQTNILDRNLLEAHLGVAYVNASYIYDHTHTLEEMNELGEKGITHLTNVLRTSHVEAKMIALRCFSDYYYLTDEFDTFEKYDELYRELNHKYGKITLSTPIGTIKELTTEQEDQFKESFYNYVFKNFSLEETVEEGYLFSTSTNAIIIALICTKTVTYETRDDMSLYITLDMKNIFKEYEAFELVFLDRVKDHEQVAHIKPKSYRFWSNEDAEHFTQEDEKEAENAS